MVAYWRGCYISACTIRSDFLGTDSVLFSAKLLHFSCAIFVRTKKDTPVSKVFLSYNFCLFEKTTNKKGRNVWPDSWSLRNSVGEMPAGYLWAFPKAKFRESDSPWNLCVLGFGLFTDCTGQEWEFLIVWNSSFLFHSKWHDTIYICSLRDGSFIKHIVVSIFTLFLFRCVCILTNGRWQLHNLCLIC